MTDTLVRQHAFKDLIQTTIVRSVFLFLPAWTLNFPHAWAFLAVTFVGDLTTKLYLVRNDPDMIQRRRNVKLADEARGYQKFAQASIQLLFLGTLAVSALDHRNDWSSVPDAVSGVGLALVAVGLYIVFLAQRANTFASTNVALHEGHQVISTGPYGRVRHPMYSGLITLMLGAPLALGSWWGLACAAGFIVLLAGRMADEEKFLATSLAGYREYTQRVRHRVVPLVW